MTFWSRRMSLFLRNFQIIRLENYVHVWKDILLLFLFDDLNTSSCSWCKFLRVHDDYWMLKLLFLFLIKARYEESKHKKCYSYRVSYLFTIIWNVLRWYRFFVKNRIECKWHHCVFISTLLADFFALESWRSMMLKFS